MTDKDEFREMADDLVDEYFVRVQPYHFEGLARRIETALRNVHNKAVEMCLGIAEAKDYYKEAGQMLPRRAGQIADEIRRLRKE